MRMIPKKMYILLLLALVVMVSSMSAGPGQQGTDGRVINGIWLTGKYYEVWQSVPNPLVMFGYPITPAMPDNMKQNSEVQYFQRARMEIDLTKPAGEQKVVFTPVGTWFYEREKGIVADFARSNGSCRLMQDPSGNDLQVCYAFLQFYDRYLGSTYFGRPISDAIWIDNRLVQYFELARMEWHPELEPGQQVILSDLGRWAYDTTVGDRGRRVGVAPVPVSPRDIQVQVYAFAERPLLAEGEWQRIYVVVRDQAHQPLNNVTVNMTINFQNGSVPTTSHVTDENGLVVYRLPVQNVKPNDVIRVQVETIPTSNFPNKGSATTWFRIWW